MAINIGIADAFGAAIWVAEEIHRGRWHCVWVGVDSVDGGSPCCDRVDDGVRGLTLGDLIIVVAILLFHEDDGDGVRGGHAKSDITHGNGRRVLVCRCQCLSIFARQCGCPPSLCYIGECSSCYVLF